MARRLLGVAAVMSVLAAVPAAAAVPGEPVLGPQKILLVRVTWGPTPFATAEVDQITAEADAFYRRQSYGKASLDFTTTPWLHGFDRQPQCSANPIRDAASVAARDAGYDPADYDVVAYLFPDSDCPWSGATYAGVVFLDGELTPYLIEHELGHAFGLAHANTTNCFKHSCVTLEYGDPYDTMGSGTGDFSAFVKARLGWLTHVTRISGNGTYVIAALEHASAISQALVVTTAQDLYWIEYRIQPARTNDPGVLVHVSPSPDLRTVVTGTAHNALVTNPGRRGRPELRTGDSLRYPAVFKLSVLRSGPNVVAVRFRWIDKTPPAVPHVTSSVVGGRIQVAVDPTREVGSGIAHYDVWVDSGPRVSVAGDATDEPVRVGRPLPGTHTVHAVAFDRAGNRSAPSVQQVRVR